MCIAEVLVGFGVITTIARLNLYFSNVIEFFHIANQFATFHKYFIDHYINNRFLIQNLKKAFEIRKIITPLALVLKPIYSPPSLSLSSFASLHPHPNHSPPIQHHRAQCQR